MPAVTRHAHHDSLARLAMPSGNFAAQIPSLKTAADHADISAAYTLFQVLDLCAALSKMRDRPVITPRDGFADEQEAAHAQADWADSLAKTESNCRGVEPGDIAHRLEWLDRAAAAGDESAQTRYLESALYALTENAGDAVRNAEAIVRAKSDGMGYLEQAASLGNIEAMKQLALEYRTNMVVPRDVALSLGYAMAVQRTGLDPFIDGIVDRWRAGATDAEIALAQVHAQRIYAACCAP